MAVKALVLCAGRGSRLRPLTHTRAKASLPVAGRPVLHHVLDYLLWHGFQEVGVVIGPHQSDLRHLVSKRSRQQVRWIIQKEPRGIAHAVSVARPFLKEEDFLLYLGDNLTNEDFTPALEQFRREQPAALIALREVENPRAFGVAEVDGAQVVRVVEKPAVPPSNLAVAGLYLFTPAVHAAIDTLMPSARGELEITDAVARLLEWERPVLAHRMTGWWQDMGTVEGLMAANTLLLDQMEPEIHPSAILEDVQIQGRVRIGADAILRRVRLHGPLVVGARSRLIDAYVGPYTSVGNDAYLEQAAVAKSVLLPGCRLRGPGLRLEDSLVGSGAELSVREGRSLSLLVGDDSQLLIPPDRR